VPPADDFVRGLQVDRTGAARYVHLIRAPDDPERSPRPVGGRQDRAPHLTLAKASPASCVELLLCLLADGIPRTFNRMAVELFDHTADIVFGSPLDEALWHLVDDERLEHTLTAPVLFRIAGRPAP
jgi:PAS domain-containing protein